MPESAEIAPTDTVKAKRGRPKKKPDYDREKEIEALQQRVIDLFGEPFGDRVERSEDAPSIREIAKALNTTPLTVRKILVTTGCYIVRNSAEKYRNCTAINALAEKYDLPILYSCHPRSKHRLEKSGFQLDPRVRVNEPLGFNDYNKLQMNALAIVSDSGTLPEESSFYLSIGHPIAAVCIRTSTERPEALEAGDFILAGITTRELLNATDMAIKMKQKGVLGKPCPDYVDETVSMKVVRIIQGYVNVVNKMVWRKY